MIGDVRLSPLDQTAERDGVSVRMSRDDLLAFELFAMSPGRIVRPKDILTRLRGKTYRNAPCRTPADVSVNRIRKPAAVLGFTIERVYAHASTGWIMREADADAPMLAKVVG